MRRAAGLALVLAALALSACKEEPAAGTDFAGCFQGGTTPQLDLFTPFNGYTWNDPHVLLENGTYHMYASATVNYVPPVRLYRLSSGDGVSWTQDPVDPVLDVTAGAWDEGSVETPAVVTLNGQYHLFYTGYIGTPGVAADVTNFRIGHATSTDGVNFSKDTANPIVSPGTVGGWDAFIVAEPGPVVYNGLIYLYYTAIGIDAALGTTMQVIGVTTSADGVTWSTPELALRPDQSVYPRGQDWIGYSTPNAIVLDGQMHLYFDVANQPEGGAWKQLRLHHAVSPNGKSDWSTDAAAIRSNTDYDWTADEIRSPDALLVGRTLRLYFAGHRLSATPLHYGISMLTCELGL